MRPRFRARPFSALDASAPSKVNVASATSGGDMIRSAGIGGTIAQSRYLLAESSSHVVSSDSHAPSFLLECAYRVGGSPGQTSHDKRGSATSPPRTYPLRVVADVQPPCRRKGPCLLLSLPETVPWNQRLLCSRHVSKSLRVAHQHL